MLHLVLTRAGVSKCKSFVKSGDTVVYVGDGVLAATSISNCQCFAIDTDTKRSGIVLSNGVHECSFEQLVGFVTDHVSSVSWR